MPPPSLLASTPAFVVASALVSFALALATWRALHDAHLRRACLLRVLCHACDPAASGAAIGAAKGSHDRERLLSEDESSGSAPPARGAGRMRVGGECDDVERGKQPLVASSASRDADVPPQCLVDSTVPHAVSLEGLKAASAVFAAGAAPGACCNGAVLTPPASDHSGANACAGAAYFLDGARAGGAERTHVGVGSTLHSTHDGACGSTHCDVAADVAGLLAGAAPSSQRLRSIFSSELDAALAGIRTAAPTRAPAATLPRASLPPAFASTFTMSAASAVPRPGPAAQACAPPVVAAPSSHGQLASKLMSHAMADAADSEEEDDVALHAKFARAGAASRRPSKPVTVAGHAAGGTGRRLTAAERRALGGV